MSAVRILALVVAAMIALPACDTLSAIAAAEAADARYSASVAAEFELALAVACTTEGTAQFAPCGEVELVLTDTRTNESHRLRVTESGPLLGALAEGDYEVSVRVDGMQMGLAWVVGSVRLHAGTQRLGTLEVRFVEFVGGTLEEQAREAERLRGVYGLEAVDFVSSTTRGLLLLHAHLEREPS